MLVQAAINGPRARAAHPALPVTPAEQAVAAVESVGAGAGAIHLHVRGAATLTDSFLARGVGVEVGLSTVRAAELFATSGLAERCLRILLEPGERDIEAALATVGAVEKVLNGTRVKLRRLLHGTDGTA